MHVSKAFLFNIVTEMIIIPFMMINIRKGNINTIFIIMFFIFVLFNNSVSIKKCAMKRVQ